MPITFKGLKHTRVLVKKVNSSVKATEIKADRTQWEETGQRLPNTLEFNLSNGGSHAFSTYLTNPSA